MSIQQNSNKTTFKYRADFKNYLLLVLKNVLFSLLSLCFYAPWAIVKAKKFNMKNIEIFGERFRYTGKGIDILKGILIAIPIYFAFIVLSALSARPMQIALNHNILQSDIILGVLMISLSVIFMVILYLSLIVLIALAIHSSISYEAKNIYYKDMSFSLVSSHTKFARKILAGFILTFMSLGIYSSWFIVNIRKYIFGNLKYGELSFRYDGKGSKLFVLHLVGTCLSIVTLGVYAFKFQANLINDFNNNLKLYKNDSEVSFSSHVTGKEVFMLTIVNILILVGTLGLGFPYVLFRNNKFMINSLSIDCDASFIEDNA